MGEGGKRRQKSEWQWFGACKKKGGTKKNSLSMLLSRHFVLALPRRSLVHHVLVRELDLLIRFDFFFFYEKRRRGVSELVEFLADLETKKNSEKEKGRTR